MIEIVNHFENFVPWNINGIDYIPYPENHVNSYGLSFSYIVRNIWSFSRVSFKGEHVTIIPLLLEINGKQGIHVVVQANSGKNLMPNFGLNFVVEIEKILTKDKYRVGESRSTNGSRNVMEFDIFKIK